MPTYPTEEEISEYWKERARQEERERDKEKKKRTKKCPHCGKKVP